MIVLVTTKCLLYLFLSYIFQIYCVDSLFDQGNSSMSAKFETKGIWTVFAGFYIQCILLYAWLLQPS